MPQYEYALEQFKRYKGWKTHEIGSKASIFKPRWNTPHWLNGISFVLVVLALMACTRFAINILPSDNTIQLSLDEFKSLAKQYKEGNYSFTVSPCRNGLIGELENGHIYWVNLGYDGRRWLRSYRIPRSDLGASCQPPLIPQYQRMALVFFASLVLAGFYAGVNYFNAKRRWGQLLPITLIQQGETIAVRQGELEYIPGSIKELDKKYNLPTDYFPMTRVYKVTALLLLFGLYCAWFAATA